MNIQMPRRWQKFVDIRWSLWRRGGLLWSWVDVVFLTVSLITLYDTQWHSTVQQVASSSYSGVKSVSFLLLSDRYHEEGSHIELFFFLQSKVAAQLLPPADIQGGREVDPLNIMGVGWWYPTKFTTNLQFRALCRYLENLHFLMSCTLPGELIW